MALLAVPLAFASHLANRVAATNTAADQSSAGHLSGFAAGMRTIAAHPLGRGLSTGAGTGQRYHVTKTQAGNVTFTQKGDKVAMEAKVSGLTPGGHGFHIHEKGDCSSGDGMSAGGHFNPTGKPHGNPSVPDHHTGDMPMLVADASGNASLSMELGAMTVGSGATDIIGKAVIVHKDPDDYTTQPTGNSGGRVACGLIARN